MKLLEGYYKYLYIYLDKYLNLTSFDEMLSTDLNNYGVVNKKDMDMYQSLSSMKYLYLRNNIYIERLKPEELEYLNSIITDNIEYNDDIESFIKRTYSLLINEYIGRNIFTNFGPDSIKDYFVNSESIVIGIRVEEEIYYNQFDDLQLSAKFFAVKTENKIDIPVNFIIYNNSSVKKINQSSRAALQ